MESTDVYAVAASSDVDPAKLPLRPLSHHLALTIYWLSNTLLWGALLHLGLQSRLSDWFGQAQVGYYLGILGFVGGIIGTVTQIVSGAFSDRSMHHWGRRRPYVVAGTMLATGALLMLGAAKSFWTFAGALILVQLFTNVALAPFTALLPDTVNPKEHGKASGFMGVARLLGDTGGLILAGQLLSSGGLNGAALVSFHDHRIFLLCAIIAVFMFVTMTLTCFIIKEHPLQRRPDQTAKHIIVGSFHIDIKGNPSFFWLSLSRAITNLGFYIFLEVLYFFLKYTLETPDPEKTAMLVMLPAIAAAVFSSIPSGMLSDRIGRRNLIFFAQFLMAFSAILFLFAPNLLVVYLAGIPAGLAYGVFTAVEWALACNLLPSGEAARYLGIWNASAVVPQILAFPLAGIIGSSISKQVPGLGWRIDYGVTMLCCLIGAYFLIYVKEKKEISNK